MIKSLGISGCLAAVLAFGSLTVAASAPAEARSCQPEYIRSWGRPTATMFGARASARIAWKRASRSINGTRYDTWWPSRRKSMKCYTNRRGMKRCLAGAYPCTIF